MWAQLQATQLLVTGVHQCCHMEHVSGASQPVGFPTRKFIGWMQIASGGSWSTLMHSLPPCYVRICPFSSTITMCNCFAVVHLDNQIMSWPVSRDVVVVVLRSSTCLQIGKKRQDKGRQCNHRPLRILCTKVLNNDNDIHETRNDSDRGVIGSRLSNNNM